MFTLMAIEVVVDLCITDQHYLYMCIDIYKYSPIIVIGSME